MLLLWLCRIMFLLVGNTQFHVWSTDVLQSAKNTVVLGFLPSFQTGNGFLSHFPPPMVPEFQGLHAFSIFLKRSCPLRSHFWLFLFLWEAKGLSPSSPNSQPWLPVIWQSRKQMTSWQGWWWWVGGVFGPFNYFCQLENNPSNHSCVFTKPLAEVLAPEQ